MQKDRRVLKVRRELQERLERPGQPEQLDQQVQPELLGQKGRLGQLDQRGQQVLRDPKVRKGRA